MRALRVVIAVAVLAVAAYALLALVNRPRARHAYVQALGAGTSVLAHGGGQGLWPDNTLPAFEGSAALGADVLELDVQRDADGAFRVIHDATLDRTTSGTGPVGATSASGFAAVDAGYRWTTDGHRGDAQAGEYHYRGTGVVVPTLREVLARFPANAVNVEIKEETAAAGTALCALLRESGAGGRVMVAAFASAPLRAFREACPEVATAASRSEVTLFYVLATLRLARAYAPPFDALQVPVRQGNVTVVTPAFVRAAHGRGVRVDVWTVNDAAEMHRLLAMGVDGLITDRPDRALRVLGRPFDAGLVPTFVAP